ncbi:MAG TPA: hypothetical protein VFJ30_01005 [Phycisphaerae bacterium]|nr:hypothetical protein [Phycisphaerae bacterium]
MLVSADIRWKEKQVMRRNVMIICDTDNIAGTFDRPDSQAIQEESRRQTEALMELRRRLRAVIGTRAVRAVRLSA